jgi:acyl carrier protein
MRNDTGGTTTWCAPFSGLIVVGGNMSEVFDEIADIIATTSEVDRDSIQPDSHIVDDLQIDSLDFLDIVFAIDKKFSIKIPVEEWTEEVNNASVPSERYFLMKNLCTEIEGLIAAKKS